MNYKERNDYTRMIDLSIGTKFYVVNGVLGR